MMITIVRIIIVNVIVLVRIFGMVINIDTVIAVDIVDAVTIYVRPDLFTRRTIFAESVSCSYEKDDPLSSKIQWQLFCPKKSHSGKRKIGEKFLRRFFYSHFDLPSLGL